MLFVLREALTLSLVALPAPSGGVAVLYTPSVPAHRQFVAALERRDASVVALAVGEPWPKAVPPRAVIAVGSSAATDVDHRWPDLPRAHLLQWDTVAPGDGLELTSTLHPEPWCTADLLRHKVGGDGWMILAPPNDHGAMLLASFLGAELVVGDAGEHHRALRTRNPTKIWLRGHARLADLPEWLELLGRLDRSAIAFVGSDLPGLRRFGIEAPVVLDLEAHAEATAAWLDRVRRHRSRQPELLEVGCAAI